MPQIKISPDEKIDAVKRYLAGELSQKRVADALGISKASFQQWIRNYQSMGTEAFTMSGHKNYPAELKVKAVTEYLDGLGSQDDICKKYGIRSKSKLQKWIMRYNSHRELKSSYGRSEVYMAKGRATTFEERVDIVSYCIANKKDYVKVMELYGVSYQQIYGWVRKYEQGGFDSLADRRGRKKEPVTDLEKLEAELELLKAKNRRLEMENEFLKKVEEIERRRY